MDDQISQNPRIQSVVEKARAKVLKRTKDSTKEATESSSDLADSSTLSTGMVALYRPKSGSYGPQFSYGP